MPLFLDGPGAERQKRVSDIVLGGPQNTPREHHVTPAPEDPARRVMVTGPIDGAFYPAKLQYWDNEEEDWADFDPSTVCWAIPYPGGTLEDATAYGPGFVVGYDEEENRAVFAVPTGGSGGGEFSGASVYNSANQSITTGVTGEFLDFDSEKFDTDGYHDTVTNNSRLTIPAGGAGYYLVGVGVSWLIGSPGHGVFRYISLMKNGVTTSPKDARTPTTSGYSPAQGFSAILSLAEGDYLQVRAAHDSSTDISVIGGLDGVSEPTTRFWLYRLSGGGGGGGSGTVTSVAMTVPSDMTISGSPITTSGTLALGWFGGNDWIDTIDGGEV